MLPVAAVLVLVLPAGVVGELTAALTVALGVTPRARGARLEAREVRPGP
ncbi:hypothetical protein [Streptantibioticus ferralitis]|uniref:Uncharacterized protein n=1 Tax=Streptantibioticus ferralitis TaxID=236510 RepID=A0ABT5YVH5_9ACTN|nr:hypothetical protein [Streptantibioticus ferralitis]MDF2255346.1 hypothetical protein [Streptantibioticus ferralitis]